MNRPERVVVHHFQQLLAVGIDDNVVFYGRVSFQKQIKCRKCVVGKGNAKEITDIFVLDAL